MAEEENTLSEALAAQLPHTPSTPEATPEATPDTTIIDDADLATEAFAETEDVTVYAEERKAQEAEETEETPPQQKRASRYERLKRARDQWKQEAEELRQRLGNDPAPPTEPQNPYEQDIEHGRREAEFAEQMAARDQQVRTQTELSMRAQEFARHVPDFHETIESVRGIYEPPPEISQMVMRSPLGPAIAYALAKDAWADDSQGYLAHLETLAGDPVAQARAFGAMEQALKSGIQQGQISSQPPRVTQAPKPLSRISGGSSGPKDIHSLAASDDVSAYVKARKGD
jgi:hypothetical protein